MIIKISKKDDDILLKLFANGKEEDFDYVELINRLHNQEKIEKIDYSKDIDEWEKEEITNLINSINNSVNNPKEEKKEEK